MKRLAIGLSLIALLAARQAPAASITHQWAGTGTNGGNELDVDDQGGSFVNNGANETYNWTIDGADVTSTLTLFLFDGSAVDDGADDSDDGESNTTGEDFSGGSGLTILEPPSILTPPITEIGALSDGPVTPFSFTGSQTGLQVKQLSYVQEDKDFAIFEFQVVNVTASAKPVKIALGGDFDIADTNSNDAVGKDLSVPMVFMNDTTANANGFFYAPGLAVAGGTFDQYRLGACCDLTFENSGISILDAHRLAFFTNLPNEECDDGNTTNGDGCSADCRTETGTETCGNGAIEPGEGCDDGNTAPGDGCDDVCRSEACGNGTLDPDEECDDGDITDGSNGCSAFCTIEFVDVGHFCSDGAVNDGATGDQQTAVKDNEVTISIDLGNLEAGTSATGAFCIVGGFSNVDGATAASDAVSKAQECITLYQGTIAVCGNGLQNAGEECDDGNTADGDGCASNCTLPGCGNSIVEAGETCDDGNTSAGDGCDAACVLESSCGDGIVDSGEECDDGNTASNDGCNSLCQSEATPIFQGGGCSLQVRR